MKYRLLLLPLLLLAQPAIAQPGREPYRSEWAQADSLITAGFPRTADSLLRRVYARAVSGGQTVAAVKAQLFLMRAEAGFVEGADTARIRVAEREAGSSSFPFNHIWHSLAAECYRQYYEQHRWQILERTVQSRPSSAAIGKWDAAQFFRAIAAHYAASLGQADELYRIDLAAYDPLLLTGINTRQLRPTLYDLLAFRALDFYESDESSLPQPANQFRIDDRSLLAPATDFVQHVISAPKINQPGQEPDTVSLQWRALRLYQDILSRHLNDARPDALIDADLRRLQFVYDYAVFPDKKLWYRRALEDMIRRYGDQATSAEAGYRLAALQYEEEQPVGDGEGRQPPIVHTRDLKAIRSALEAIITRFRDSEGGMHAQQLLDVIVAHSLELRAEEVVLPGEPSKILVGYKNVPHLWLRLLKLDEQQYDRLRSGEAEEMLSKAPVVRTWDAALPGTADHEQHFTELPVVSVQPGAYAILVSESDSFGIHYPSYVVFQATRIGMVTAYGGPSSGYVLDRKSGRPMAGAVLDLFANEYNSNTRTYVRKKRVTTTTDAHGAFTISVASYNHRTVIRYGGEAYYSGSNFRGDEREPASQPVTRTFFFTDRSIYRPGQTIYFKGITVRSEPNGQRATVVSGVPAEISLYDVNGQKVKTLSLKTNEYGSCSGSFTAPAGLTGQMYISDQIGEVYFSVEEYKRPKFRVLFDTVKASYALNESVTLRARAEAYAGNVVDGASVQYRVARETRWPYEWLYGWRSPQRSTQQVLATGTVLTDAQGAFTIAFTAAPDPEVDAKTLPVFTYTVYAAVTDAAGETRSSQQSIKAGYRSLQIESVVPEKAGPAKLDSLRVRTVNLADQFVPASLKVSVASLQAPAIYPRARLWQQPDQYVLDEPAFRKLFPLDEYRNESDYHSWKEEAPVWEKEFVTTKEGILVMPPSVFSRNGWYRITFRATDKNGQPVEERKYFQVWGPGLPGRLAAPLSMFVEDKSYQPGEVARAAAVTAFDSAYLFVAAADMNRKTTVGGQPVDHGSVSWSRPVREQDRGGISIRWLMLKDNRVYKADEIIRVPWSNKELNLSWATHRDKLQPGAAETWTVTIRGSKQEKLAAEMVATLYDASLDAFRDHQWDIGELFPDIGYPFEFYADDGFGVAWGTIHYYPGSNGRESYIKRYDELMSPFRMQQYERGVVISTRRYSRPLIYTGANDQQIKTGEQIERLATRTTADAVALSTNVYQQKNGGALSLAGGRGVPAKYGDASGGVIQMQGDDKHPTVADIPLRKNLQETAFFYPQLKTDAEGNIHIVFTLPEALTEWKFMALAHTREMAFGQISGAVKTQKDLMVQPNLPRFFRQGDDMVIAAKISNLSERPLNGTASLELVDAQTLRPLNLPFRLADARAAFSMPKGQSTTATWRIHVPQSLYEPVLVRISAQAGSFTDGEENALPVLSNRMLVTETLPLWTNGAGTKSYQFDKLLHSDTSRTLSQYSLTLEYTSNPAWYAVQALPYLAEYPYECAEQTFNRYYANALAAHILDKAPRVKEIFKSWQSTDTAALQSNLEKNGELKSALLEETPWVLQAESETQQKHNIALLFDSYRLGQAQATTLRKLQDLVLLEGAFPWFKGMYPDRYITQYIATGLSRLGHLGMRNEKAEQMGLQLRNYLSRELAADYRRLLDLKVNLETQQIGYLQVQYLYLRSFDPDWKADEAGERAFAYYKKQAVAYWPKFNPYMKGLIALSLHRLGESKTAQLILQSLRETSVYKEDLGRYWMQPGNSYWWYEAPVEAQSLLIECFGEVAKDTAYVDELKRWLLKQKQTQNWRTTKATADACYALLLGGTQWLTQSPEVTITLGDKTIRGKDQKAQAGTGYFKVRYAPDEIKPTMGNIQVNTSSPLGAEAGRGVRGATWGAVYWQYFEDMDRISPAATPLVLRKQLFIERNGDRGPVLEEIKDNNQLHVGDRVKVRIVLQADRDMEYVHLKDQRAACFEPVNVLSGYRWQGGLGYYESTRDASSNFFISYLPKGTYVFEYPVNVMAKGDFSNGIATIQCMYAPEFSSHSEGIRVKVE